ncbi:MAG: uroporphyrinogen-III synthase [Saprospiraceae bacterium]|nr:uroporphyrinogen-III synthase [Saprospiraceae bacterium]
MTAFISRSIMPDSDFYAVLKAAGWQVSGQSFVTLTPIVFEEIPSCEWLFFSSQNAVRFFFQQIEKSQIPVPDVKWAALGPSTARALEFHRHTAHFTGTGEPRGTAQLFRRYAAKHPVSGPIVFPAARRSRQSVMTLLHLDFQCVHFDIYDNQPVPNPQQRTEQVLAFTSPMNAEAYFSQHVLLPGQKVAAIGGTTDRALQALGIRETAIAAEPNEYGLAEAVLTLGELKGG